MRLLISISLILLLSSHAYSQKVESVKMVDPFINPIKVEEEKLKKLKEQKEKLNKEGKKRTVNLFKPAIPKPLDELSIQGVISSVKGYLLIVLDPETGETYMLKEGDAISPSEKIVKITPTRVVIVRYFYKKGKLFKSYETLNVNSEG